MYASNVPYLELQSLTKMQNLLLQHSHTAQVQELHEVQRLKEIIQSEYSQELNDLKNDLDSVTRELEYYKKLFVDANQSLEKELSEHEQTKMTLSDCRKELAVTGAELEKFLEVSQTDRKKMQNAFMSMRDRVINEAARSSEAEALCSSLKSDKANCEDKLQNQKEELNQIQCELETKQKMFQRHMTNKEAQKQQLLYMASLTKCDSLKQKN